jgi:hypothetical protein
MSWVDDTLEDFKTWLGVTDDAAATRALTLALATVETWLDRPLEKAERTETNWLLSGVIRLRAWPVETVSALTIVNGQPLDLSWLIIDNRTGLVCAPLLAGQTTTTYIGGYDPMPADLELALWQVAAALYPTVQSAAGASTGQAIKRVTTPDVGTVEFATNGAAGGEADSLLGATLSPQIESLLARYRAESVVGGA